MCSDAAISAGAGRTAVQVNPASSIATTSGTYADGSLWW